MLDDYYAKFFAEHVKRKLGDADLPMPGGGSATANSIATTGVSSRPNGYVLFARSKNDRTIVWFEAADEELLKFYLSELQKMIRLARMGVAFLPAYIRTADEDDNGDAN